MTESAAARRITIVAYPGVQVLDVTGPHEVFSVTNRLVGGASPPYQVELVARAADGAADGDSDRAADGEGAGPGAGTVRASSGLRLVLDRRVDPAVVAPEDRAIDTLVVVGGEGTAEAAVDPGLLDWVRAVAPGCRRIASVCSGTFILAAAGLLDGRRVTTHWSACDLLAELFPSVTVDPDPIFVRDGPVTTSAGVTAGMDLALALVEEDLGREAALQVSRWLVMFVQRPGGQSQFSTQLAAQLADRQPLRELQRWIVDHLDADLSVPALAERVAMSPRHFARVFRAEVGVTPARYVERHRVELARRLLETTGWSVDRIARQSGFGTVETLQRAFRRSVRTTPREYRRLFSRHPDAAPAAVG